MYVELVKDIYDVLLRCQVEHVKDIHGIHSPSIPQNLRIISRVCLNEGKLYLQLITTSQQCMQTLLNSLLHRVTLPIGLIALLSFYGNSCLAQDTSPRPSDSLKHRVFAAPLNVFDPVNPSLSIGYERWLNDTASVQFELGYITRRSVIFAALAPSNDNIHWTTHQGFKVRVEYKEDLRRKPKLVDRTYFATDVFYIQKRSEVLSRFKGDRVYGDQIYSDTVLVYKQKFGVNLKYGMMADSGKRLNYDISFGLGAAYRINTHSNRIDPTDADYNERGAYAQGERLLLSVSFNARIGYYLENRKRE